MKKLLFLIITTLFILNGCGNTSTDGGDFIKIEDLDKEKAKNVILEGAVDSKIIKDAEKEYSVSDFEIIKLCEAYDINETKDEFTGRFQVFWKTSDGKIEDYFQLTQDYTIEKVANQESIDGRCLTDL